MFDSDLIIFWLNGWWTHEQRRRRILQEHAAHRSRRAFNCRNAASIQSITNFPVTFCMSFSSLHVPSDCLIIKSIYRKLDRVSDFVFDCSSFAATITKHKLCARATKCILCTLVLYVNASFIFGTRKL